MREGVEQVYGSGQVGAGRGPPIIQYVVPAKVSSIEAYKDGLEKKTYTLKVTKFGGRLSSSWGNKLMTGGGGGDRTVTTKFVDILHDPRQLRC
jgi:hypothetical protein